MVLEGSLAVDAGAGVGWRQAERPLRAIDVRSPAESAQGTIDGAEPMPLHLLPLNGGRLARELREDEAICPWMPTRLRSGLRIHDAARDRERGESAGSVIAWARGGG
jgi:hypothetical protein